MSDWDAERGSTAAGWEANAERIAARLRPVTDWLLDHAGLNVGDTVLDVAAGPGEVGHAAAEIVGSSGRVLSTDWADAMVEAARRIGARRGLSNVEYRVMDAQAMDLDDSSVDVALCRSGYMLMPDPVAAFSETRRVLRPGGSLAFSVFAAPERNPFVRMPGAVLVELGHREPPPPGAPGVFALSAPDRLRSVLADGGFDVVAIEAINLAGSYPSAGFIVDQIIEVNPMVGSVYEGLDEAQQQTLRQAMLDGLSDFVQDDGTYELPTQMWGVRAE